jgi:hypothetical protein
MSMRQPARLSPTPAYGLPEAIANEQPCSRSGVLALLILVIALAVATVWYVALPAFSKPLAKRSCEVVVLESGATRCVPAPVPGSRAVPRKTAGRAKR